VYNATEWLKSMQAKYIYIYKRSFPFTAQIHSIQLLPLMGYKSKQWYILNLFASGQCANTCLPSFCVETVPQVIITNEHNLLVQTFLSATKEDTICTDLRCHAWYFSNVSTMLFPQSFILHTLSKKVVQ
jgi:hypothetical protein